MKTHFPLIKIKQGWESLNCVYLRPRHQTAKGHRQVATPNPSTGGSEWRIAREEDAVSNAIAIQDVVFELEPKMGKTEASLKDFAVTYPLMSVVETLK